VFQEIEKRKLTRSVDRLREGRVERDPAFVAVSHLLIRLGFVLRLSRGLVSLLLTLTRLVVVFIFANFSFVLFTPPLGDFHK
jgi:hypothetical protein